MTTALESRVHDALAAIPEMGAGEYEQLRADMEKHGQREACWTAGGYLIDGRARLKACVALGVKPIIREYTGDDVVGFIASLNVHRRHLTPAQRAVLAVELLPYFKAEAAARQAEGTSVPDRYRGRATEHAAKAVGAGRNSVSDLARLQQTNPELYEEVKHGPLSVADAQMLAKVRDDDRSAALELLGDRKARSAREAIELVFAERGEDVPARILSRPHRDVLIDELRRVLADGIAKADAGDEAGALGDLRRAHDVARGL
jgi:ParB-like chromosome segregation protein Spo0J